jgi:predicted permease
VAEHVVSGGYFRTLGIPIVAGRTFDDGDRAGSPAVVIVSAATARQLWPGGNPIGQQLERDGQPHEVIGVVGDVRGASGRGARGGRVEDDPAAAVYLSMTQFPQGTATLLLRSTQESATAADRIRSVMRTIDPAIPLDQVRTVEGWLAETIANPRLTTVVAATFAAIAVLLAAVGVYGVVAYSVGRRTAEIGLRMAIGATRYQVLGLVLRAGLASAAAGGAIGLGGALLVNRALRALLFGVRPDDPRIFVSAALLLGTVLLVACYLPARRAARVDPLVALRSE